MNSSFKVHNRDAVDSCGFGDFVIKFIEKCLKGKLTLENSVGYVVNFCAWNKYAQPGLFPEDDDLTKRFLLIEILGVDSAQNLTSQITGYVEILGNGNYLVFTREEDGTRAMEIEGSLEHTLGELYHRMKVFAVEPPAELVS